MRSVKCMSFAFGRTTKPAQDIQSLFTYNFQSPYDIVCINNFVSLPNASMIFTKKGLYNEVCDVCFLR